ncbi:hypothetical protein SVTN_11720 [Streptomyces vietnamensis]|uniref:Uncharacterized protein n=1 Tax=Streptomyces vietnamensis TaxID=362257 RepID=A0A0B5I5R0_9ACTN|nr:hypothetical protein SVTN_11720 [Streptomyces vietnamensis]
MPRRHQPRVTDSAAAYQSSACRIGTHHECAHSAPTAAPVDIPVVYEACGCSCHPAGDQNAPKEVPQ